MYTHLPKLYMWKERDFKELFEGPTGARVELPLFGLMNSLRNNFKDFFPGEANSSKDIENSLRKWIAYLLTETGEMDFEWREEHSIDGDEEEIRSLNLELQEYREGKAERPVTFNSILGSIPNNALTPDDDNLYVIEILFLLGAFNNWLLPSGHGRPGRPNRKTPSQKYSEEMSDAHEKLRSLGFDLDALLTNYLLRDGFKDILPLSRAATLMERNMQFHTLTLALTFDRKTKKRITTECFISKQGFIPLVWAEMLYAVRNDIFAKLCPTCNKWYPIKTGRGYGKYGQQKYCEKQCRLRARADREKKARKGRE